MQRPPKDLRKPVPVPIRQSVPKPLKHSPFQPQPQQNSYRLTLEQANVLFESEKLEQALALYQQLCKETEHNEPFKQLCRCYRQIAKGFKQQKNYQRVVDLLEDMFLESETHPENFKALDYKILGEAYLKLGRFEEAQEATEDALYLNPDLGSAQELLKNIKAEKITQQLSGLKDLPYDSFD